ncbi:MAG: hypothetical protein WCW27_03070 [Patescibacteria group bacterium]|jgi:mRNA-degrading endonuclease RelE of RelBE toxin-antitoxin system
MDKITKALLRLTPKEQVLFKQLLLQINAGQYANLDCKRLKGQVNIYRVRKGKYRIIFRVTNHDIFILALEQRSDNTYNNY